MQRRAAEVIIAETGVDMTALATAGHLASWAGVCRGNDESAGKRCSGRTRKGSKWLHGTLLIEAGARATHPSPPNTSESAPSRSANRASLAVAHSLLIAVWHTLQTDATYLDPGGDYYTRRDPERMPLRLVAQLERLGHTVTLTEGVAG